MYTLWQDIRFGFRMMLRAPGFAVVAILTLALGIGANTAIFSVVKAVLLSGLPYRDSDRLVMVFEKNFERNVPKNVANPGNVLAWRESSKSFEDIAALF